MGNERRITMKYKGQLNFDHSPKWVRELFKAGILHFESYLPGEPSSDLYFKDTLINIGDTIERGRRNEK